MPDAIAELQKQGAALAEGLGGVTKTLGELKKKLDEPMYPRQRTDEQGRVTSFMEETDETIAIAGEPSGRSKNSVQKAYRQNKRQIAKTLKADGYQPWGEFKSFGDFVRTGLNNHQSDAFRQKLYKHFGSDSSTIRKAVQGLSEGSGADGGFTVMPEFSNQIFDRIYDNDLWARTDNYTVSGNNMTFLANAETSRATGSRHGGLQGYWMNEGGTITKSKPTVREVSLKLVKLGVVVYLTQELIDDTGVALEQYVTRKASEEFNFMIGDSLVNGTGVGQPLGFLNCPSLVSIAKETGQAAASLQPENIVKMYSRFYAPSLSNSFWLHNQDICPQLDLLTLGIGAAGISMYTPPGGLSGAPYGTLRGRPMQPSEFAATIGTQGDLNLVDFGQILSISKGGIAQAVSMHLEFLTDQMALRFTMRLNARPWDIAPITPYKGSNTQSTFVTLDTRA